MMPSGCLNPGLLKLNGSARDSLLRRFVAIDPKIEDFKPVTEWARRGADRRSRLHDRRGDADEGRAGRDARRAPPDLPALEDELTEIVESYAADRRNGSG